MNRGDNCECGRKAVFHVSGTPYPDGVWQCTVCTTARQQAELDTAWAKLEAKLPPRRVSIKQFAEVPSE